MPLEEFRLKRERTKRASIVKGARKLFSRQGFTDVTTAALAAEGGVSTATLYKYFNDKESLFSAVIDQLVEQITESLAQSTGVEENGLYALSLTYANLLADPEFVGLMRVVVADAGESASFRVRIEEEGNALFFDAIDREVRALLPEKSSDREVEQAAIELRSVLDAQTLLVGLLYNEFIEPENIPALVERTLASWRSHWLS